MTEPTVPGDLRMPTLEGARRARKRIAPYLPETPLFTYPALDRLVGASVWVKHENHQPVGAFKVRGGVNLIAQMDERQKARGIVAASTGNHGQSVAYAGRLFGASVKVFVPEGANPVKVQAMQDMGAEVIGWGGNFDEAREHCAEIAAAQGYRYVHSGNEPDLIEGVATYTIEILETRPSLDVLIVPIGGGSGASGACIAGKDIDPSLEIIGVQAEAAPAAYLSWSERGIRSAPIRTGAEGLATGLGFELPQQILWERLDDFVLVTEDEIRRAIVWMIEGTRNLVEGAGAAALAAAVKLSDRLRGKEVGIVCSGGNISPAQLEEVLRAHAAPDR